MPEHEVVDHGSRPWPSVVGRCVLEHGTYAQVTYVWNMVIVITNRCLVSINVNHCEGGLFWKIERKANQCDDKCVIVASAQYRIRFWEWAINKSDLIWSDLTLCRWEQIRLRGLMWSCQWLTGLSWLLQCYCSTSVKPALAFSFILTLAHWCSLIRSRGFHITH